jgi:hypothetical protein
MRAVVLLPSKRGALVGPPVTLLHTILCVDLHAVLLGRGASTGGGARHTPRRSVGHGDANAQAIDGAVSQHTRAGGATSEAWWLGSKRSKQGKRVSECVDLDQLTHWEPIAILTSTRECQFNVRGRSRASFGSLVVSVTTQVQIVRDII